MHTFEELRRASELLTSLTELEGLRRTTLSLVEQPNVSFVVTLEEGKVIDLTLPKEDFIVLLDRNIAGISKQLFELGFE